MRKVIRCGKADFSGKGRKANPVELELELEKRDGRWMFACCGSVFDQGGKNALACGQCLEEIFACEGMEPYREIYDLWKLHHRNDLHAGTEAQERCVNLWLERTGERYDYARACEVLDEAGLLCDKDFSVGGSPYRYGTAWLWREIPAADLKKIRKWMRGARKPARRKADGLALSRKKGGQAKTKAMA